MYFSLFLLQVVDQISNNDIILHSGLICTHGFFAIYIRHCVYMHFNNANKSPCLEMKLGLAETGCGRDKERGVREKRHFFFFFLILFNEFLTAFCPRGQFMHWNPELLHSMRHLVSSTGITPSNEWGKKITLALRQQWPLGDWMVGLESEELCFSLCVFISLVTLWAGSRFLKGNSTLSYVGLWIHSINMWCEFRELFCDKDHTFLQPASLGSISVGNSLVFPDGVLIILWLFSRGLLWTCCWFYV